jgi:SanA protein
VKPKFFKEIVSLVSIILLVIFCPILYMNFVLESFQQPKENFPQVAIVLGAGILDPQTPSLVLQKRLDIAVDLYANKKISKILVTGDNRAVDYNEPAAMISYLVSRGVPEVDITPDYAGIRTIESCYRAKNVFNIQRAYVITQRFHLPRTLFLCNNFGIEAIPIKSNDSVFRGTLNSYFREVFASWSAILEVKNYTGLTPADGNEADLGVY